MRPVVTLLVAVAVLVAGTACGPNASSTRPVHCAVIGDPPERDNTEAPKRIVASVRFWCDPPGSDKLTVTLRLQKQNSKGAWYDVSRKSFSAKRGATTRPEDADTRYRTWSVSIPCADGDYRTVLAGANVSRNVTKTYESTGAPANNPCQPTIFH